MLINVINSLVRPLEKSWGLITYLLTYFITLIADVKEFVLFMSFAVVADAIFGTVVSVRINKKPFLSQRLRDSATKVLIYLSIMFLMSFIDRLTGMDKYLAIRAICILIIFAESYSILVSFTILCPKSVSAKLLKGYMVGEIAKKLDKSEEEVRQMIDDNKI